LTTATTGDDITAFPAVQEPALKCWDLISGDSIDKRNTDLLAALLNVSAAQHAFHRSHHRRQ
jgi:hypothetical protein